MGMPLDSLLCSFELAKYLEVPVVGASTVVDSGVSSFLSSDQGLKEVSAAVFYYGVSAFIITNDAHGEKRLRSNVAHELAHILLKHPPEQRLSSDGTRQFSKEHEAEANWLGPALLVSDEAAIAVFRRVRSGAISLENVSDQSGISREVLQMRLNVSGVRRRVRY